MSRTVDSESVESPPVSRIVVEGPGKAPRLATRTFDPDSCERRRRPPRNVPEPMIGTGISSVVHPLEEWEVLDVSPLARCNDTDGYWEGAPRGQHVKASPARRARASIPCASEQWEVLHHALTRAVVPARKSNEWNVMTPVLYSGLTISEIGGEAKVIDVESRLEALLDHNPFVRASLLREWPCIETGRHKGFIAWKVHHSTHTKDAD